MSARARIAEFRIGAGGRGPQHRLMLIAAEKARHPVGVLVRLWQYLRQQRGALIAVLLLVSAGTALGLVGPILMRRAIDENILRGNLTGLGRIVVLMIIVHCGAATATWLQTWLVVGIAQRTVREIRRVLFGKLQSLPIRFFDRHTTGELMSRLTNDVDNVSATLSESVSRLFAGLLRLTGAAALMLVISWRLALVTLLTVPLIFALSRWVSRFTLRGYREQQEAIGLLNGLIEENITGAKVVKAYCREQTAIEEFDTANARLRTAATKAMTFAMLLPPMVNMANNMGYAVVAGAGGWMAVRGWVTVGTIAAFISYAQQFGRPLNELANLINTVQAALAGAERVFEIIDQEPEVIAPPDTVPLDQVRGEVSFDGVCFGYEPNVPVLKDVSLRAQPGRIVALVGPTGAGKTTMVNLLSRFYEVENGVIRIDDRDIRHVRKDDLRRRLGIVLQDGFLFSDTVMENIRYGRLDASDEAVLAAAKLANADPFIRRLPDGYQTRLSERGGNLSQGQRQLLAIARALLGNPAVLILDEATSSVDTRTEKHIQEAMIRLMEGRTSLVIAHRLSTIRDADTILVINEGRIIERGAHEELMARRGFYHRLYMSQFKGHLAAT